MNQADELDHARFAGPADEGREQRSPETDPHPPIADTNRELRRVGVVLVADIAGGPEALAGFGIDRDQRLVALVVDGGQIMEQTARQARLVR